MKIAVIGGIGSGKSEIIKVARQLNIATLSADEINAKLLKTPEYVEKLSKLFPEAVKNGAVDKAALSAIVFSDESRRLQLNALSHPEIFKRISECKADPLIVELPLVLESGVLNSFDEVILVETSVKNRTARLIGRGLEKKRVREIMKAQVDPKSLRELATIKIENNGDLESFRFAAAELLNSIAK